MPKLKVNVQLLPMKVHYLLWHGGVSCVFPFMVVHAKQLGFSGLVIGMVYAMLPLCKIILNPLLGAVADKYKIQKTLLIIMQIVNAGGYLSLAFLPALPKSHMVNFTYSSNGSAIHLESRSNCVDNLFSGIVNKSITCKMNCPSLPNGWHDALNQSENMFHAEFGANILKHNSSQFELPVTGIILNGTKVKPYCVNWGGANSDCDINCDDLKLNEMVSKPKVLDKDVYSYHNLWLLVIVVFVCLSSMALTATFADSACFQILGENRYKYGFQKMFCTIGFGAFGIITGLVTDLYSSGSVEKNHRPSFVLGAALAVLGAMVSYKLQYVQEPYKAHVIRNMKHQLRDPRMVVFILWCITYGVGCGVIWGFLFWLLEELAAIQGCHIVSKIKTIEGISLTLESLAGGLPFYIFLTWIFKRLSYTNAMTLSFFLMGIQLIFYSCMSNPWWNLPIAVLNGGVAVMGHASMASYASVIAPRGTETTTQGLTYASSQAGISLGSFLGGVLVSYLGAGVMFRVLGISFIVLCVLHASAQCLIAKCKGSSELQPNQVSLL